MNQTANFYVQKKKHWLKFFNSIAGNQEVNRLVLQKYFLPERIPDLWAKVQQQFEELLPQLPDFGTT
jgi:hypothetical protein